MLNISFFSTLRKKKKKLCTCQKDGQMSHICTRVVFVTRVGIREKWTKRSYTDGSIWNSVRGHAVSKCSNLLMSCSVIKSRMCWTCSLVEGQTICKASTLYCHKRGYITNSEGISQWYFNIICILLQ